MAKISIVCWKYQRNLDGTVPLYLRIYKNRRVKVIATGYSIPEKDWDEKTKRVKSSYKNHVRLNNLLNKLIMDGQTAALDLEASDFSATTKQIVTKLKGTGNSDYFTFANSYVEKFNNPQHYGTYKTYRSKLKKLKEYLNGESLSFNDIDVTFLRKYESYLESIRNRINSIHGDMKRIRSIYYASIREGVAEQKKNPFFSYKLKTEKTHKVRLTEEEMNAIRNVPLEEGSLIWHCRNEFILSFNFMGMRVKDVLLLKWEHLNNGHLDYQMHKSKDLISISMTPEASSIIKWYADRALKEDVYVLPFFSGRKKEPIAPEIESKTAIINKYLKKIADSAGIRKKITTHCARHSWAQRAIERKIPIGVIQRGLGHSSVTTTQVYLNNMGDDEVNAANKVITR